ncbi:Quinone oxidoreductase PIG3 [Escovopsis weberi]|uniref:Quinone oxidoreductase PIG3 n=1 Tax=Escovopsis weberi TaxID=150374 RepID=A0A0M8MV80_ESCWE|nr:Quinone oxidoreductase PIG3 [Escovopsis weberi]
MRKPAFLSHERAAAAPENWMTATQVLHLVLGEDGAGASAVRGKTILWHAGASGVSSAGIQLALAAGASAVYATAGSQDKLDFITARLGATAAFNYKTQDWVAEVQAHTGGRGVDCIVDFVGADYFQKNLEAAARDGKIAILGTMSGRMAPQIDVGLVLYKRLRVQGSSLRSRDVEKLSEYVPDFESGKLTIYLDSVFPCEKIQEAHGHMEDAKNSGKIVCTIP